MLVLFCHYAKISAKRGSIRPGNAASRERRRLPNGIDYISKIKPMVSQLSDFEAAYRTRSDFSVTTFSDATSGGISVAITSGRVVRTSTYIKRAKLPAFRNLITEAKAKLDAAK